MSPSEIRNATLSELRAARTAMMGARWTISLEDADKETKELAAKHFLDVHHAIQKLENMELSEIRDKLVANEEDLAAGREKVGKALKNLGRVKDVLGAIGTLLGAVSRVIPLLL